MDIRFRFWPPLAAGRPRGRERGASRIVDRRARSGLNARRVRVNRSPFYTARWYVTPGNLTLTTGACCALPQAPFGFAQSGSKREALVAGAVDTWAGMVHDHGVRGSLVATFLDPDTQADLRWAATDALALLNPGVVTHRAILPLLDAGTAEREGLAPRTWKRRADWYERLAYLIGKIRAQTPVTHAFLDRCLYEFTGVWLKAKAIQSLGWMYDHGYKDLFEQIAIGDFSNVALRKHLHEEETVYLRRKAIQALANIGDQDTLAKLRAKRTDWCPELERAFYWTSEEIHWRSSLGSGQLRGE